MSQPRTMEERVAALEAELERYRPKPIPEGPERDVSTVPRVDVRKRMEGRAMRGET